ncbi:src-like-adapter 2 isoform X2 [Pan troglodytes]|uniref:src-like-adapter 2 isoform X2 n=1 Tax=Pan troglodytes TaxID=9598 RepID=UPI0007DBB706|nr:src-like-adapter 2 isoform X3 [Pan troglodytes]
MGSLPSRRKSLPSPSLSSSVQGQGPVTMEAERSKATAVALGSFPAGGPAELSLRLGEPLTIVSEWLYEGLSREKAEELLLLPGNPGGAFLIRESQTRRGSYSLSVRLSRPASWDRIRHYRIHRLDNGWLYISPRLTFPSLQALVDHYSEGWPAPWQGYTPTCDCAEDTTQLERAGQVKSGTPGNMKAGPRVRRTHPLEPTTRNVPVTLRDTWQLEPECTDSTPGAWPRLDRWGWGS